MEVSFIYRDKKYSVQINNIKEYPGETLIHKLIEYDGSMTQKDGDGNILINSYGDLFDYIVCIINERILNLRDLLTFYVRQISSDKYYDNIYIPSIFYYDKYSKILEMLEFYMFDGFSRQKLEITIQDIQVVQKALHEKLKGFHNFITHNNICVSGSYPLKFLMDQMGFDTSDWNSDIDMYISEHDFSRWIRRMTQKRHKEFDTDTYYGNFKYNNDTVKEAICKWFSDKDLVYESQIEYEYIVPRESIKVEKLGRVNLDEGYGITGYIDSVWKIDLNGQKIDLVVTKYNPKNGIDRFDFNFNKIYWDGYALSVMDWDSILHMETEHVYGVGRWTSDKQKFIANRKRIQKYIDRGFYIWIDHTEQDSE